MIKALAVKAKILKRAKQLGMTSLLKRYQANKATKINYSSEKLKSDSYNIVRRWRLEPSDLEAYNRGELVEPIKPIIYYLDPGTPLKWRKYFKMGIEDWNSTFEKAGFKNAIIAKDPPSKEEDPDFSPEDIRYSTVRYVASTTRNAMGPSVSDPRTGEIIESDIVWYHNHLRSYRNRYLLETGAANPSARTLFTPEKEIGEMMRMVIAHEIGHALCLALPFDGSTTQGGKTLTDSLDVTRMTVMSYTNHDRNDYFIDTGAGVSVGRIHPTGPGIYDIMAMEYMYGTSTSTNLGDTTYSYSDTPVMLTTILDSGGTDTIDGSNQSEEVRINLTPGGESDIGS